MKKITLLLIFCCWLFSSYSQKISRINFDSLQKIIGADSSVYTQLFKRFKKLDSTLTKTEYSMIYYGQVFMKAYDPFKSSADKEKFEELYRSKKYSEALEYADKILLSDPLDLSFLYHAAICYRETGNMSMKRRCNRAFNNLLDCIEQSGDGLSCKTSYVITHLKDSHTVLSDLNLEYESELLDGDCDYYKVNKSEKFTGKKIYFNIYWSNKKMKELQGTK